VVVRERASAQAPEICHLQVAGAASITHTGAKNCDSSRSQRERLRKSAQAPERRYSLRGLGEAAFLRRWLTYSKNDGRKKTVSQFRNR
jgi:hypothetical protein